MPPHFLFRPLLVLAFIGVAGGPLSADDRAADGAMRLYRDPDSGAIGRPSAAAQRAAGGEVAPAPAAPLVEEAVRAPAGGRKVHLRGRHRQAMVRHLQPDGTAVHECHDDAGAAQ